MSAAAARLACDRMVYDAWRRGCDAAGVPPKVRLELLLLADTPTVPTQPPPIPAWKKQRDAWERDRQKLAELAKMREEITTTATDSEDGWRKAVAKLNRLEAELGLRPTRFHGGRALDGDE